MNGVEHVGHTSVESFHHDRESQARAAEMPWWRRSKATRLMHSYLCYPGITEGGKDGNGGTIMVIWNKKRFHQRDCRRDVSPQATSGRFKLSMYLLVSQQGASKPDAETLHRCCCWTEPCVLEGATTGEDPKHQLAGWEVEVKVFHSEMHVTNMYVYAVPLLDAEATLVSVTAKEVCV